MFSTDKVIIEQTDNPFINFVGTNNISTTQGAGADDGPLDTSGWAFADMVKIQVNGTDYWIPAHTTG